MLSKNQVYQACLYLISQKINNLENTLAELAEGIENESKSSAGDKHETSRAMLHNEQEKIAKQLHEVQLQKSVLEQIPNMPTNKIGLGNLIKTNKGYLFLAIALGKIKVDDMDVFVLSAQSPLGMKLIGLQQGNAAEINGVKYLIEDFN